MDSVTANSPDIDKGWAIAVLLSGVFTMIVNRGLTYTSAIFYITFLDEFEESPVYTSWAVSLNIFCSLVCSLFVANIFLPLFGNRITVIIGCVLSSVGLLCCSFAKDLAVILVMYGIVTGIGFAFAFVATYTVMAIYFKKYRIVAFGIMYVGTGVGQLLFPPFLRFVIDEYVWRGAFIILAGINLNLLVVAACYMPPREADDSSKSLDNKTRRNLVVSLLKKLSENISVFKDPHFLIFGIAIASYDIGFNGYQTHIANYGRISGLSTSQVTFLPSIVGIGSMTGNLLMGIVTQIPKVPVVGMFMLMLFVLGAFSIVVSFVNDVVWLFVCSFASGFSLYAIAMSYEVIIFTVGMERFTGAVSFGLAFAASGSLAGGPIAAAVYDRDPSYRWTYRVLGLIVIVAVFLIFLSWLTISGGKLKLRKAYDERNKRPALNSQSCHSTEKSEARETSAKLDFNEVSADENSVSAVGVGADLKLDIKHDASPESDKTRL